MKLILENWKRYLNQQSNNILVEKLMPLSEAEKSVVKRSAKLFKGWLWGNNKEVFDLLENTYNSIPQEAIGSLDYVIPTSYTAKPNEDIPEYLNIWNVIGNTIYENIIKYNLIPSQRYDYEGLNEEQKTLSTLWVFRQLSEGKIIDLEPVFNAIVSTLEILKFQPIKKEKGSHFVSIYKNFLDNKKIVPPKVLDKLWYYPKTYSLVPYFANMKKTARKVMIEDYFNWIDFVPTDKRDINSISSYDELFEILKVAAPLYKEWELKQKDNDSERGQQVLLDNDKWQVIILLNKGAACKLGKGSDWCTAAPGLDHFHRYSKPNDPIFFILDKSDGERYQFHFGTSQFHDFKNKPLYPERSDIGDKIKHLLANIEKFGGTPIPRVYTVPLEQLKPFKDKK